MKCMKKIFKKIKNQQRFLFDLELCTICYQNILTLACDIYLHMVFSVLHA
jgi:hypothetical protein